MPRFSSPTAWIMKPRMLVSFWYYKLPAVSVDLVSFCGIKLCKNSPRLNGPGLGVEFRLEEKDLAQSCATYCKNNPPPSKSMEILSSERRSQLF